MDLVNKMIALIMEQYEKEFGEGAKLEAGDFAIGVFNDATMILYNKDEHLDIVVNDIKPYSIDFDTNLFLEESKVEE